MSYVVYDVYKCSLCGSNCSPLDSILYKEKTNTIIHFDEDGNEYVEKHTENAKQITHIKEDVLLCNEFTTEYHENYKYSWTHKNCCNHYSMIGPVCSVPMYGRLCAYIRVFDTPYSKIKTTGNVNKNGNDIIDLIKDGNLLFKKHKHKKTQEKAEYFEYLMYSEAVKHIINRTAIVKKRFEVANGELNERREHIKKKMLRHMLYKIRPELFTNILIKKYHKKEINFETFKKNMIDIIRYRHNDNLEINMIDIIRYRHNDNLEIQN